MTVLGNIVAVASIIAVVSLIQGLNASVRQAILNEAGADSFIVQQYGIVRSDEEWLRVQSNPRITRQDADAVKKYSPLVSAVMLSSQAGARVTYRSASIDGIEVTGVTPDYIRFSSYDAERGRLLSPTEIAVDRRAVVIGAQLAGRPLGRGVELAGGRAWHGPQRVDRWHRSDGGHARIHQFFKLRCRARAADQPDRNRRRSPGRGDWCAVGRSTLRTRCRSNRQSHSNPGAAFPCRWCQRAARTGAWSNDG